MHASRSTGSASLRTAARVRTLMRQLVALLKTAATHDAGNEAFMKAVDMLYTGLRAFLEEHDTLSLRIRSGEIAFGGQVVYVPIGRSDELIHPLYRDGVRRITFNRDLTRDELAAFAATLVSAREMDPYESDLVTTLWEKDLANITYEASDVYLERDEGRRVGDLAAEIGAAAPADEPAGTKPPDSLLGELALMPAAAASPDGAIEAPAAEDLDEFRSRIMGEDDSRILEISSNVCLEILESTDREEVFRTTARFLGEICDWLVSVREFMPVCTIISDLHTIAGRDDAPEWCRQAVAEVVRRRSESEKISGIEEYIEDLSDAKLEELFCYLAQMDPVAVQPLCRMLAEAGTRRVRYMLARAISIVAKDSVGSLAPFLNDKRWYVVRNIVMIMGMIATEDTLPYLADAARHAEPRVRREAARALGRIRKPGALPALKILLQDDNKMIRLAAVSAVGLIGGDAAEALIREIVLDKSFDAKATDEKRRFMEVYGSLGEAGVAFLEGLVDGRYGSVSETTTACAAYGLAAAGGSAADKALRKMLSHGEGSLKYAASEAISMIDGGRGCLHE